METLAEYLVLFVLVAIMGAGLPGPGDASLIAAGTLAGEGKLNIWIVLATAMAAWMLGSVVGYGIGVHGGRRLLDHPGRLEKSRLKLLAKGDRAFGRYTFVASVTMPAFVSGIFRVRFYVFMLGALTAGIGWIGIYVGLSYFLGEEIAKYRTLAERAAERTGQAKDHGLLPQRHALEVTERINRTLATFVALAPGRGPRRDPVAA